MNSLAIIFTLSILLFTSSFSTSFSESDAPREITIVIEPPRGSFDDISLDEKDDDSSNGGDGPTSFVTGSQYAKNGSPILIDSAEGIILNDQLVDQIIEREQDILQNQEYLSRIDKLTYGHYGLADPLLNPTTDNTYFDSTGKHNHNVKSNFEYYVLERGYDPRHASEVPNNIFSPTKYQLARAVMEKAQNDNANNLNIDVLNDLDLRVLSPNAFVMTEEQKNKRYHNDVEARASTILNDFLPSISSSSSSNGDLSQDMGASDSGQPLTQMPSGSGNSQQQSSQSIPQPEDKIFQNTDHIKEMLAQEQFVPNYSTIDTEEIPLTGILISIVGCIVAAITGFVILKRLKERKQLLGTPIIATKPTVDYVTETQMLLESAKSLYKTNQIKDAYERFSQAIRFYYSYHYTLEKEVTTFEILSEIKKKDNLEYKTVFDCLALCGMIEFARHKESKNEFKRCMERFMQITALPLKNEPKTGASI